MLGDELQDDSEGDESSRAIVPMASELIPISAHEVPGGLQLRLDVTALSTLKGIDLFDDPARVAMFIEAAKLLPHADRDYLRMQIQAYGRQYDDLSNNSDNRASTINTLASTVGGGLVAGGLLLLATNPITLPLCAPAGAGAVTLFGGVAMGFRTRQLCNQQKRAARLCNDIVEALR